MELTKAERIALQLTHAILEMEGFPAQAAERKAAEIYFRMVERVESMLQERQSNYDPYQTLRERLGR